MLTTADFWAENDISYGGHFRRIGNPVNVKAWAKRFLHVFLVYVFNKLQNFWGYCNDFKRSDQQIFSHVGQSKGFLVVDQVLINIHRYAFFLIASVR